MSENELIHITREIDPDRKAAIVSAVLADLPEWFGLPAATAEYVAAARALPFWAASAGQQIVGFIDLGQTSPVTGEINCLAIKKAWHRQGIGRRLVAALEAEAADHDRFLQVKTVAAGHYLEYDQTNAFYRAVGFAPFEVFPTLWAEQNPCQVYVKTIQPVVQYELEGFPILPDQHAEADEWLTFLRDHQAGVEQTLIREHLQTEQIFSVTISGTLYLCWYTAATDLSPDVSASSDPIDQAHVRYWHECVDETKPPLRFELANDFHRPN